MSTRSSAPSILTIPVDLLKHITTNLSSPDEASLKLTCRRLHLLIGPSTPARGPTLSFRPSTPPTQSPLTEKATITLEHINEQNRDVEERELERGMELSDSNLSEGEDETQEEREIRVARGAPKPTKFTGNKIALWNQEVETAPASPYAGSPAHSEVSFGSGVRERR